MRFLFILALSFCSAASGQLTSKDGGWTIVGSSTGGSGAVTLTGITESVGYDGKPSAFVVQYSYDQKCWGCWIRTAMVCPEQRPDCNVPKMATQGFKGFDTLADALRWASGEKYPEMDNFKLVSISKTVAIPVQKKVTKIEIPQPVKVIEAVEYLETDRK